jgi:hypothetical protein
MNDTVGQGGFAVVDMSDNGKIADVLQPGNLSWTGWSVLLLGCRARRNDAEWSFHSKELHP